MIQKDTPPHKPQNLRDMMDEELEDVDDLVEITFDDIDQLSDDTYSPQSESTDQDDDDNAYIVFMEHRGSIFSCDIDKDGKIAVTGGEDDKAYFWDTDTGNTKFVATGFKDSVHAVEFSHDGKFVATADLSGVIKVWKMSATGNPHQVWSESLDEILWIKWHNKAHVLLSGLSTGHVYMWKIPSGECKLLLGSGSGSEAGIFMPDGKRGVIGYKDGQVKVFDLNSCRVQATLDNQGLGSILCLAAHSDNNLIAAGSLNSGVVIYATQTGKVVSKLWCNDRDPDDENEDEEPELSVESVAFSKDSSLPILAIATTSTLLFWDFAKQVFRHKLVVKEGVTKLMWDIEGPLVYVGTQDGEVNVVDVRSSKVETQLRGHEASVLDMAISRDGKKMITTSDDSTARVFILGITI